MKQKFGNYYLGLDIGTDSVGWAVTDEKYEILDFNGKAMWGVHLFDSGKTAEERRLHRCSRRRLERRKQRINLLRELFASEISKIDPTFYERLDESRFFIEDRKHKQPNTLFNDPNFKDRDLHKKYPTIYHLRSEMMKTDVKPDIRLIYLAAHHIIKYRGHFLFEGISDGTVPDFEPLFRELLTTLNAECDTCLNADNNVEEVQKVLVDHNSGIKDKKITLIKLFSAETSAEKSFIDLMCGGTAKLGELFNHDALKTEKLSFKGSDFDERHDELEDLIGSDKIVLLDLMKQTYDWSVLSGLLEGHDTFSEVKIKQYNQHKKDLKTLKAAIKNTIPNKYKETFESENTENNYCSYTGVYKKKIATVKSCSQDDFCKYLRGLFKDVPLEGDEYTDMKRRIEDNTFMPKQTTKENSVIPNALHRNELSTMLNNVSKHYPFLKEKDDSGISIQEKIELLCTFRIPYYVGPLNEKSKEYWAVRKEGGKITPWNFENKIDLEKSSESFIENLTNMCTFLVGEKVVPKNSIIYSRYELYNELNTTMINRERIDNALKKEIVRDLFEDVESVKKVTVKSLEKYLRGRGLFKDGDVITGIDEDIKSNLKSEVLIKKILKDKFKDRHMVEDIIRSITIFGDDRSRLKKKLFIDYSNKLTKSEIDSLSKLQFSNWGRFSEKFLTGIYHTDRASGVCMNILTALEQTNLNLMELMKDNYSYNEQRIKMNNDIVGKSDGKITYDLVENEYMSPAVKRGIWRTMRIIQDIVKITGHFPKKIFLETTRENQEIKKRTTSRKQQLISLFKACKEQETEFLGLIEGTEEGRFRGKKLYSYYTQCGKCMYCGKKIELNDLENKELYDMDHIYPQSKKTDDSLHNNLVLVCKPCNQRKSDIYPLPEEWQRNMHGHWTYLLNNGLITKEKHARLVRISQFSEEELNDFVSRQLIETSQSVKAVAEIMKKVFGKDSDIVYVKGNNVSDFRNDRKFTKCRSVNDYHHAKDAYLNIVVGNVYDVKFTKNPINVIKSSEKYNLNRMYDYNVERNGVCAWIAGEDGTIKTVSKYMKRNNIRFTRFAYEEHGKLFDQNLVKACPGKFPAKSGEVSEKYGGYDNISSSYFVLIEHEIKGKKVRTIESVPVHVAIHTPTDKKLIEYFENVKDLVSPKLLINRIKMKSTFEIDGFRLNISGRTGKMIVYMCGEQLVLPYSTYDYCKKISKHREVCLKERRELPASDYGITSEENIHTYDVLLSKLKDSKYNTFLKAQVITLESKRATFASLPTNTQSKVINEILHVFQCNPVGMNLKDIGGPGQAGRIILNNNIMNFESAKLINQSPSGLFESTVDLNKI
jgi:CRISPR-associated protein Cas9/Csn1, subtype II/NMEMI